MSGYGPAPLARDAHHAERLYWQRNPPSRPKNGLTVTEAARALGILPASLRFGIKAGRYAPMVHGFGNRIFFNAKYIADLALARYIKKAAK